MTKFEYYFYQTLNILLLAFVIAGMIIDGISLDHWLSLVADIMLIVWCPMNFAKNLREYRKQNQEQ